MPIVNEKNEDVCLSNENISIPAMDIKSNIFLIKFEL